mmetsp:Transcript_8370/g.14066  ORF Transcript_8370/g.14066 Transcript_8370/m.14066 type:complete len:212 (+) Transcript_8370:67-702(+)|eukprot:CAMPEP_0119337954 /NCGR_PEP_ID=MMETSP1333-20130426/95091_1 /TAXON_ID=418940 /ORGANISM="Scyphosphaera apsteinii, Strain RCC1455" /LENGTH=211 /DNA_ID=CAMNT_0007349123 /DNA_START=66 /DNA_END=701 /DNA_ORIENTATION=+
MPVQALLSSESLVLHGANEITRIERFFLDSDGTFPNNRNQPLLLYQGVYEEARDGDGSALLMRNGWSQPWAWGVFTYHHYHSNAWEALLCVRGEADVQFGGPSGPFLRAAVGDLVLIPPGVAHKQGASSGGFLLLGSYPVHAGCPTPHADTVCKAPTLQQAENIKSCPVPLHCPRWGAKPPWEGGFNRLLRKSSNGATLEPDATCVVTRES